MAIIQSPPWLRPLGLLALTAAPFFAQQPIPRPKFEDLHASAPVGNRGPAQGTRFWLDFLKAGGFSVDQLRFHLSNNSTTPTYGGTGVDHEFSVTLRKKDDKHVGRVVGFFGTQDVGRLESLGLLCWAGA